MAFTDSDPVEVSLPIVGVWIHDEDDPFGTLAHFPYGDAQRSDGYDSMGEGAYYVGHVDPIFDYGDAEAYSIEVTIDVPNGPDYIPQLDRLRGFAAMKRPVWYRDNRSRAVYGVISGFKASDIPGGSQVSFSMTRHHRPVTLVS